MRQAYDQRYLALASLSTTLTACVAISSETLRYMVNSTTLPMLAVKHQTRVILVIIDDYRMLYNWTSGLHQWGADGSVVEYGHNSATLDYLHTRR